MGKPRVYTRDLLKSRLERDGATLIRAYNDRKSMTIIPDDGELSLDSIIEGICKCGQPFTGNFRQMNLNINGEGGFCCRGCTLIKAEQNRRNTNIAMIGFASHLSLKENTNKGHLAIQANLAEVVAKRKETSIKTSGYDNPSKNPLVKQQKKYTTFKNFGVEHNSQSPIIKQKKEINSIAKFGVRNPMQNAEVAEKCMLAGFQYKPYTWPSGRVIEIQGVEPHALDDLLKEGYKEEQIITGHTNVPDIRYILDEVSHRYYTDIYIPHENTIIEVKSDYTLLKEIEKNKAKRDTSIESGYEFRWMVYRKDGSRLTHEEVEQLLNTEMS